MRRFPPHWWRNTRILQMKIDLRIYSMCKHELRYEASVCHMLACR